MSACATFICGCPFNTSSGLQQMRLYVAADGCVMRLRVCDQPAQLLAGFGGDLNPIRPRRSVRVIDS